MGARFCSNWNPKWTTNGTKIGPNWDPKWIKNGTKNGPKLEPKWDRNGTRTGPKLEPKRDRNETVMGFKQDRTNASPPARRLRASLLETSRAAGLAGSPAVANFACTFLTFWEFVTNAWGDTIRSPGGQPALGNGKGPRLQKIYFRGLHKNAAQPFRGSFGSAFSSGHYLRFHQRADPFSQKERRQLIRF